MRKYIFLGLLAVAAFGAYGIWKADRPVPVGPAPDWSQTIAGDDFTAQGFFVPVDGAVIEAMILMPNGLDEPAGAVVFTGGSGDGLFQNYRRGFLATYLQEVFLPRGIAVVYANKRGMGASTGNWMHNTIEGRAADVNAVADAVRAMPGIDPARVGLAGHSQGGWVVVRAAAEDLEAAFVLNFMGPLRQPWDQFDNMWRNIYLCDGMSAEDAEAALARKKSITEIGRAIGKVLPVGPLGFDARFFDYRTDGLLEGIHVPLLSVYGSHDVLVDGPASAAYLASQFPGGVPENFRVHTFEGLNHGGFRTDALCAETFGGTSTVVSPELQHAVDEWLAEIGF